MNEAFCKQTLGVNSDLICWLKAIQIKLNDNLDTISQELLLSMTTLRAFQD